MHIYKLIKKYINIYFVVDEDETWLYYSFTLKLLIQKSFSISIRLILYKKYPNIPETRDANQEVIK